MSALLRVLHFYPPSMILQPKCLWFPIYPFSGCTLLFIYICYVHVLPEGGEVNQRDRLSRQVCVCVISDEGAAYFLVSYTRPSSFHLTTMSHILIMTLSSMHTPSHTPHLAQHYDHTNNEIETARKYELALPPPNLYKLLPSLPQLPIYSLLIFPFSHGVLAPLPSSNIPLPALLHNLTPQGLLSSLRPKHRHSLYRTTPGSKRMTDSSPLFHHENRSESQPQAAATAEAGTQQRQTRGHLKRKSESSSLEGSASSRKLRT